MDLLKTLPQIVPGNQDDQAREIYSLIKNARNKGRLYTWYEPPTGILINTDIKNLLKEKGMTVIEQLIYDLTWDHGEAIRGTMHRKYFIGAPGRK